MSDLEKKEEQDDENYKENYQDYLMSGRRIVPGIISISYVSNV